MSVDEKWLDRDIQVQVVSWCHIVVSALSFAYSSVDVVQRLMNMNKRIDDGSPMDGWGC